MLFWCRLWHFSCLVISQVEQQRMKISQVLSKAKNWGQKKYPSAAMQRHAAFANSVCYLVTGLSGGYGGPSIREHAVSWSLISDGSRITQTNLGNLTVLLPDGRLPMPGHWDFNRACQFAETIVYGQLPAIAKAIIEQEHCFDDDPEDLKLLGK